jgi:hypothetical protein
MTVPVIGKAKQLDSRVLEDHGIVAVFGICEQTLCVHGHALQRYKTRGRIKGAKNPALEKLYRLLSSSMMAIKLGDKSEFDKHGCRSMFRIENGWIFILSWVQNLGIWLLKTTLHRKGRRLKRSFEILPIPANMQASTWSPLTL